MIADDELDETIIQDALRILNDLQTGLSVPYKQRKKIGTVPSEKQAKRMLKDIHVLEVQCLEVAAIAYHFGRKCKSYRSELDTTRDIRSDQNPALETLETQLKDKENEVREQAERLKSNMSPEVSMAESVLQDGEMMNSLLSLKTELKTERETVQRIEVMLGKMKDQIGKMRNGADLRTEEVKEQMNKGFKDLERVIASAFGDREDAGISPDPETSVRESLQIKDLEKAKNRLEVEECEYIEIRAISLRKISQKQTQTAETDIPKPHFPAKIRLQALSSMSTEILPVSAPRVYLTLTRGLSMKIDPIFQGKVAKNTPIRMAAPLQLSDTRPHPDYRKPPPDLQTLQICSISPKQKRQNIYSLPSVDISGIQRERDFAIWRAPELSVNPFEMNLEDASEGRSHVPQPLEMSSIIDDSYEKSGLERSSIDTSTQTIENQTLLRIENRPALLITPIPRILHIKKADETSISGVSKKSRNLDMWKGGEIVIKSWSLMDTFAFATDDSGKEEEHDPATKRRARRKVVRKDPIEEFFTLVRNQIDAPSGEVESAYERYRPEGRRGGVVSKSYTRRDPIQPLE